MAVEAGDQVQVATPALAKLGGAFMPNFVQGFETVGSKARTDCHQILNALAAEAVQNIFGIGPQPRFFAEARLETAYPLFA